MPNGVIIDYEVSYWPTHSPVSAVTVNTTAALTATAEELAPETEYTFTVRAYSLLGAGELTSTSVTTSPQPG